MHIQKRRKPLKRTYYLEEIRKTLRVHTLCGILGPRQVGKTTLSRQFAQEYYNDDVHFFWHCLR